LLPRATAEAVTDNVPDPQTALKSRDWLDVTETATYPDFGFVTFDDAMVTPF
jgi:hypothetical protein